MPLDASTTRRLALIRYAYTVAVSQTEQPEPMSALSIMGFHDAAELFLQLASEHVDAGAKQPTFMDYWDLIGAKLPGGITQRESMRRLSKARNGFKHHGTLPSRMDLEAFRATATNFFRDNTPQVFGVEFDAVSLLDLVVCEKARDLLRSADEKTDAGDFDGAIGDAALSLAYLIEDYEYRKLSYFGFSPFSVGREISCLQSIHLEMSSLDLPTWRRKLGKFADDVADAINAMQTTLKVLSLGIDYRRYARFSLIAPQCLRVARGEYQLVPTYREHPPTADEARNCRDFVIESALTLQGFDFDMPPTRFLHTES